MMFDPFRIARVANKPVPWTGERRSRYGTSDRDRAGERFAAAFAFTFAFVFFFIMRRPERLCRTRTRWQARRKKATIEDSPEDGHNFFYRRTVCLFLLDRTLRQSGWSTQRERAPRDPKSSQRCAPRDAALPVVTRLLFNHYTQLKAPHPGQHNARTRSILRIDIQFDGDVSKSAAWRARRVAYLLRWRAGEFLYCLLEQIDRRRLRQMAIESRRTRLRNIFGRDVSGQRNELQVA